MYSLLDQYVPITVPESWDAETDCAYFEERWHPEPSYTGALWEAMRCWYEDFVKTLDRTLRYFRMHDASLVYIELSCLTPLEKIETLSEIASHNPRTAADCPRLFEALQACEIRHRHRLLGRLRIRLDGMHGLRGPRIAVLPRSGFSARELTRSESL